MGSTASRPTGSRLSSRTSASGLRGLSATLRRLRRRNGPPAADQTTRVPSEEANGVEGTDVGGDASPEFSHLCLNELRMLASNAHPSVNDSLAAQTHLRSLELNGTDFSGGGNLGFLTRFHNLDTLAIDDCRELTSKDFQVLLELPRLNHLVLGIETLSQLTDEFCASCLIDLSLILYGQRCSKDSLKLGAIQSLVSVKFIDFWTLEYPLWVKDMSRLESLSFVNGTVRAGTEDFDVILPASLKYLSCLSCHLDRRVLSAMLCSGRCLLELELDLPHFVQDNAISRCTDLRVLKISTKECDGEVLEHLSSSLQLRIIELTGCQYLNRNHLIAFTALRQLERISISCSCVDQGACDLLASLDSLQCLEFHCCVGINLDELQNAHNLRCIALDRCICTKGDLNKFLASDIIEGLDSFQIGDV